MERGEGGGVAKRIALFSPLHYLIYSADTLLCLYALTLPSITLARPSLKPIEIKISGFAETF